MESPLSKMQSPHSKTRSPILKRTFTESRLIRGNTLDNSQSKAVLEEAKNYRLAMTKIVQKFELLDIPQSELEELRYLIENKIITGFKDLLLHIMRKCINVMPDSIARSIGSHISQEDTQTLNWDAFLQILEEEVSIKEKLYNQMNFGSNKVLFEKMKDFCLSTPPRAFFYHDYQINRMLVIPDKRSPRRFNLFVSNDNCLVVTDPSFSELICRVYFSRNVHELKKKAEKYYQQREDQAKERQSQMVKISMVSQDESGSCDKKKTTVGHNFDVLKLAGFSKKRPKKESKSSRPARLPTVDRYQKVPNSSVETTKYISLSVDKDSSNHSINLGSIQQGHIGVPSLEPVCLPKSPQLSRGSGEGSLESIHKGKTPGDIHKLKEKDTEQKAKKESLGPSQKKSLQLIFATQKDQNRRKRSEYGGGQIKRFSRSQIKSYSREIEESIGKVRGDPDFKPDIRQRMKTETKNYENDINIPNYWIDLDNKGHLLQKESTIGQDSTSQSGYKLHPLESIQPNDSKKKPHIKFKTQDSKIIDRRFSRRKKHSVTVNLNQNAFSSMQNPRISMSKKASEAYKIESLIERSRAIEAENNAQGPKRMSKIFQTFRSIVKTSDPTEDTGFEEDSPDDGDSMFEEIDCREIKMNDVMIEYSKRAVQTKFKNEVKDYKKHASAFNKNLDKIQTSLIDSRLITASAQQSSKPSQTQKPFERNIFQKSRRPANPRAVSLQTAPAKKTNRFDLYLKSLAKSGNSEDANRMKDYKNWYDRPRNEGKLLTSTDLVYWPEARLILVPFLTREIMTFRLDYRQGYFVRKIEEFVFDSYINQMCVTRNELGQRDGFFLMAQVAYSQVNVYLIQLEGQTESTPRNRYSGLDDLDASHLLENTFRKDNLLYALELGFNPHVKLLPKGIVVIDSDKVIQIHKQTTSRSFQKRFEVPIAQKYQAVTVKEIDYSSDLNQVLVGTTKGDVYLVDVDLGKVVFKINKFKSPILKCQICEVLKCFFVFWENGRFSFYDLMTFREVQEFNLTEGNSQQTLSHFRASWAFFPDIDQEISSLLASQSLQNPSKDADSSPKPQGQPENTKNDIAQILGPRIDSGMYSIFFGGSSFTQFQMKVDRELQFSEIIAKIKMLERHGKDWSKDTLFGHEISNVIIQKTNKWVICKVLSEDDGIILVNDRKLLIYLNYVENLIVRYSLLQIEGKIINIDLINNKKEIFVANDLGKAIVYNLVHMNATKTIDLQLERCIFVDHVFNDDLDVVAFHMPDEVFFVKATSRDKLFVQPNLESKKEVQGYKAGSTFLQVITDNNYIYCILENFKVTILFRRTMRVAREIDLMLTSAASKIEESIEKGGKTFKILHNALINQQVLFLQFEDGTLLFVKFNKPNSFNDMSIYWHRMETILYNFAPSHDNSFLYVVREKYFETYHLNFFEGGQKNDLLVQNQLQANLHSPNKSADDRDGAKSPSIRMDKTVTLASIIAGKKSQSPSTSKKPAQSPETSNNPSSLPPTAPSLLTFSWSLPLPSPNNPCPNNSPCPTSLNNPPSLNNNPPCPPSLPIPFPLSLPSTLYLYSPFSPCLSLLSLPLRQALPALDIYSLIGDNKTFDQKRLNESNVLNVRNILRVKDIKGK